MAELQSSLSTGIYSYYGNATVLNTLTIQTSVNKPNTKFRVSLDSEAIS